MSTMECTPQRVHSEIGHLINNQDTCHCPQQLPTVINKLRIFGKQWNHRAIAPTPASQAMAGPVFSLHLAGLTWSF